jgi:hypothetical protein
MILAFSAISTVRPADDRTVAAGVDVSCAGCESM